jgi:hypothetical protein
MEVEGFFNPEARCCEPVWTPAGWLGPYIGGPPPATALDQHSHQRLALPSLGSQQRSGTIGIPLDSIFRGVVLVTIILVP